MEFDFALWKQNILNEVRNIADEDRQRRSWLGVGPEADSPVEQICAFDDARVPEFIASPKNGLNQAQRESLAHLTQLIDKFMAHAPLSLKPVELLDDANWRQIREQAKIALHACTAEA